MQSNSFNTIPSLELEQITGGDAKWNAYLAAQRKAIGPAYKQIACTSAGVIGAGDFIKQIYDSGTVADKIRGANMLKDVCMHGSVLPEQAAKAFPF